jgi:paraquat-inducible protein B
VFYHFSYQEPVVRLVNTTAEGMAVGKTKIKSRSVDVGMIESVTLSDDLNKVKIQVRLNSGICGAKIPRSGW